MNVVVDVEIVATAAGVPTAPEIARWVQGGLGRVLPVDACDAEIAVRIVSAAESRALNANYRAVDRPTNVLAFPADVPDEISPRHLGDLVLCADVIAREAETQGKTRAAHYAHMLVHGCLHLAGYDHEEADAAAAMEAREVDILASFGYSDPYTPVQGAPEPAGVGAQR